METRDDDLTRFAADGAAPLPAIEDRGYVENDGARIWKASYGSGAPVILLPGVSHFAPLQRPEQFNGTMLAVLETFET